MLPQNMVDLLHVINDPSADFEDLAAIVRQDPKLATQTLHMCNSAYYAFPVEIVSVAHAVKLVGLKTVAGLAMAAYFQGLLESRGASGDLWLHDAKNHIMTVAHLAEYFTRNTGVNESPGTAFTGGLLHDIGKLVFAQLPPEAAKAIHRLTDASGLSLLEAEQAELETDHAAVGSRLADLWDVPIMISDAVRYHHRPMESEYLLTLIVHISNEMAHYVTADTWQDRPCRIVPEALDELGLTEEEVNTLATAWATGEKGQARYQLREA